jgi:carbon-monoxide dehydrogenase small subunit
MLGIEAEHTEITTIEGMMRDGKPHPLQNAFADLGAAQCGYCIPGILLTAKALLEDNPRPTRDEIRQSLSGNLCRCTGYTKIIQAIELAVKEMDANVAVSS